MTKETIDDYHNNLMNDWLKYMSCWTLKPEPLETPKENVEGEKNHQNIKTNQRHNIFMTVQRHNIFMTFNKSLYSSIRFFLVIVDTLALMNENFINKQPKQIQKLLIIYLQLRCGYIRFRESFEIWCFMMTHDVERLNMRYCGLNAFDEFYGTLGYGTLGCGKDR